MSHMWHSTTTYNIKQIAVEFTSLLRSPPIITRAEGRLERQTYTALTDRSIHAADNRDGGGATVSGGDVQCVLPTILLPSTVNYEVTLQSVEETTAIQIDNTCESVHPYPLQPQGDGIGMAVIMAFLRSEQESDLLYNKTASYEVLRIYLNVMITKWILINEFLVHLAIVLPKDNVPVNGRADLCVQN